jgi:uncharacterized Ntn-hydrolase superfamily protein
MAKNKHRANKARLIRPISTYSIVARDVTTGEMGVAVQSHWFSVGSVVSWAEAGVGAVATQAMGNPEYGQSGLAAMRSGEGAPDALKRLLAGDEGRDLRQVAMIDADGRLATHTGRRCIKAAGHITDEKAQFSVQANMMVNDRIWPAMAKAYCETQGDLADRLVAALQAAEAEGGDIRGRQSAALLVVSARSTGRPWIDRRFDLRVEDHPQPVDELKRLVRLKRAYLHMNEGDLAMEKNDAPAANREYAAAEKLAPELAEIPFWCAVTLVNGGKLDDALPIFRDIFEREKAWARLIPELVKSGLLLNDPAVIKKILAQAP